jgi:WhiB family transcriptional regulator, redox-sensing transcriptional regulator
MSRPGWHDMAACRYADPALFFPEPGHRDTTAEARAICARCPVFAPCYGFAEATGQIYGIWAGTTQQERRAMRRTARLPEKAAA